MGLNRKKTDLQVAVVKMVTVGMVEAVVVMAIISGSGLGGGARRWKQQWNR